MIGVRSDYPAAVSGLNQSAFDIIDIVSRFMSQGIGDFFDLSAFCACLAIVIFKSSDVRNISTVAINLRDFA